MTSSWNSKVCMGSAAGYITIMLFSDMAWLSPIFILIKTAIFITPHWPCDTMFQITQLSSQGWTWPLTPADLHTLLGKPTPRDIVPKFSYNYCCFLCQLPSKFNNYCVFICFVTKWLAVLFEQFIIQNDDHNVPHYDHDDYRPTSGLLCALCLLLHLCCDGFTAMCPWASYQIRKITGCACAWNAGNVFPATDFEWNRLLAMWHVPWCMSGSLTHGGGENVPGIRGAGAIHKFTYLARGPWDAARRHFHRHSHNLLARSIAGLWHQVSIISNGWNDIISHNYKEICDAHHGVLKLFYFFSFH